MSRCGLIRASIRWGQDLTWHHARGWVSAWQGLGGLAPWLESLGPQWCVGREGVMWVV